MIKGYIFDYGGTLDTRGNHWGKVIWHAYERCGVKVSEEQFREGYVHAERTLGKNPIIKPDFTFYRTLDVKLDIEMQYLVDNGYWQISAQEMQKYHDAVLEDLYKQVIEVTSESREVLEKIAKKYPMVLVSNFYGNVGVVLSEFKLDHLFPKIIESAVVGVRKPNPQIFALGVEALGMKAEETVVVGDSMDKDINPAKSLGCNTIWFKGEPWNDNELLDTTCADKTITNLKEIMD